MMPLPSGFKLVIDDNAPPGMVILSSDEQVVTLWQGKCQIFKMDDLAEMFVKSFDEVMGFSGNRLPPEEVV